MPPASVVVCIGGTPSAQKLIAAGAEYAREIGAPLKVLHVTQSSQDDDLETVFDNSLAFANLLDAELIKVTESDVTRGILGYLQSNTVSTVLIGRSSTRRWRHWALNDISSQVKLHTDCVDVKIIDVTSVDGTQNWLDRVIEFGICIAAVLLLTGVLHIIQRFIAEADIMMAYLAVVVVLAYYFNRAPTLFAAIASVAAFDFFFVTPFYTFAVDHEKYLISFAVMAVVGFLFSSFSERAKQQLRESSAREAQLKDLYHLARSLAAASTNEDIARLACFHISTASNLQVGVFQFEDNHISLTDSGTILDSSSFSFDQSKACIETQQEVSDRVNQEEWKYHPMGSQCGLVLITHSSRPLTDKQHHLLQTYLSLIKLAITRSLLSEQATEAQLQAESEQLRNAILSAVSHDLRTPLGTIMGLTSTLLDQDAKLNEMTTLECLNSIYDLSEQLSQKVTNLLQMSRNLRGKLTPKIELQNPEEFVGGTLARIKHRLENHAVDINMDDTLLIPMDIALMEVVLSNLLDNAAKFSPAQSLVKIRGKRCDRHYFLSIEDQGVGLKESDQQQLFDHFFRVNQEVGGTGLGLAISKAIVEAHSGHISAINAMVKGAVFTVELPLQEDQQNNTGLYE